MRIFFGIIFLAAAAYPARCEIQIPQALKRLLLPSVDVPMPQGVEAAAIPQYHSVSGSVDYEVSVGPTIKGHFDRHWMRAGIDRANPSRSTFNTVIDMNSIVVVKPWYVRELDVKEELQVAEYQQASARTLSFRPDPSARGGYEAELELFMAGKLSRTTAQIRMIWQGKDARVIGSFPLKLESGTGTVSFDLLLKRDEEIPQT